MHDDDPSGQHHVAAPGPAGPRHPPITSIEDVIVFKLSRFVAINHRLGDRWTEAMFKLNVNEWRMLALVQAHGALRASDLAEAMLIDKSQLSRLIRSLTAKKLIRSAPDKNDARAVSLSVSVQGQMLYEEVIAEVLRRNERVLAVLSPEEVRVFDGLLDRLVAHNLGLLEARRAEDAG